jgi:hypothetical protein
MALLTTLYPIESFWGVKDNFPVYEGYLRVGLWNQIDAIHPNQDTLGRSTAIIEFDLRQIPRGRIIDSAILFIDHDGDSINSPDVSVYGYARTTGNPSDLLEVPLNTFAQLSGPFGNEDIILDVTDFVQTIYNELGLYSFTDLEMDYKAADFILGSSLTTPGFRSYIANPITIGGSRPSIWITTHVFPRLAQLKRYKKRDIKKANNKSFQKYKGPKLRAKKQVLSNGRISNEKD